MSLYFLFKKPRNQKIALAFGVTVGVLTGGYKILIGDHFLSHTIVTKILEKYKKGLLIVCLSTILVPSLASLKSVTNVPCPVDIIEFGGDSIDVKILESYPKDYIQEKNRDVGQLVMQQWVSL